MVSCFRYGWNQDGSLREDTSPTPMVGSFSSLDSAELSSGSGSSLQPLVPSLVEEYDNPSGDAEPLRRNRRVSGSFFIRPGTDTAT